MKRLATLGLVAVISFLTGGWFLHREPTEEERLYEQARVLGTVLSVIHDHSLESADQNELFQNTARNLVAQLKDPYAELLVATGIASSAVRCPGRVSWMPRVPRQPRPRTSTSRLPRPGSCSTPPSDMSPCIH